MKDKYEVDLKENIPSFDKINIAASKSEFDMSSTMSSVKVHGIKQIIGIIAVAIIFLGIWEILVRVLNIQNYIFPTPSAIIIAFFKAIPTVYTSFFATLFELVCGYIIGVTIGLLMAVFLTLVPYFEKIITPYILLLITTPTLALVPLLMLRMGFTIWPRIIAVALAAGPMVMINSAAGFKRTDLAKIALAKSYGASESQIFLKIRFPLAAPMIIVGLMVGGIFGLITAVGADMVGGAFGLGNKLSYYSSLARMDYFFAVVLMTTIIGISIWLLLSALANKVTSWQE